ncbi:MAG: DUF4861 domain-containing protein [Calditrichaeota bacterium]|nr:DUF4861 domain-containing protein [Calditrichota bacterium]
MKYILILLFIAFITSCRQNHPLQKEYPNTISVSISNDSDIDRTDELISIKIKSLAEHFNANAFVVIDGQNELASQAIDLDSDGNFEEVAFLCTLKSRGEKTIKIIYAKEGKKTREYPKRTQAELSHKTGGKWVKREYEGGEFKNVSFLNLPPEHTDHSWYLRYEGPGWESDKVGYRFYMDWRNAVDIYGKKTPEMVLQNVGKDGFDSYHEMADWGMDILKVGSSLGIGSIGMWIADSAQRVEKTDSISCSIETNGVIQSSIKTNYFGWQIDNQSFNLSSSVTINAGSRLTKCDLKVRKNPSNLCTGIVKHDSAEVIKSNNAKSEWQYLATYGKQSLNNDNLGMAVIYKASELETLTEDKHSNVVVLKPSQGFITYYYLAAWELEPSGIKNKETFIGYLDDILKTLNNPISVRFN